ncbi:MAG: hypothetical protein VX672_06750 [Planctomycetota bacterium]|nr:hypothetical protein [Planctomycetota bacterium]
MRRDITLLRDRPGVVSVQSDDLADHLFSRGTRRGRGNLSGGIVRLCSDGVRWDRHEGRSNYNPTA